MYTDNVTIINAATQTTTSDKWDISLRKQVGFQFTTTGVSGGSVSFSIDASNDGLNWITSIAFQDATATASTTWVTSKSMTTNTTSGGFLPLSPWRYIRVVASIGGVITATCVMQTQS